MEDHRPVQRGFGVAWVTFACAMALHAADEATHHFLATYNANALAIRGRLPLLRLPTLDLATFPGLMGTGVLPLLCLAPFAFRGDRRLRFVARPLAIVAGVMNSALHLGSSIYFARWMPGVYSSPVLLAAASYLLAARRESASKSALAAA